MKIKLEACYALRAAWAIPIEGEPIRDARLIVENDLIRELMPHPPQATQGIQTIDLGNVALLPGLVNAHAHLEFSDLEKPLGRAGVPLPEWIGQVFTYRRDEARDEPAARIAQGRRESAVHGTTLIGDIATSDDVDLDEPGPGVIPFHELIGLTDDSVADCVRRASDLAASTGASGLSPHAPYTVRRDLLTALVELSAARDIPLMMHVGETTEELELLASGSGSFAELLKARGVWSPELFPGGSNCLDYLRILSRASRALVVHGNYFRDDEFALLAEHAERMSLVYCPRTHAYFQHPPHGIVAASRGGALCAIGTDGRGSSPDLDMLAELRFAARQHADLTPTEILRFGTLNGAIALGWGGRTGSLIRGKQADMVAIELDASSNTDPCRSLLHGTGQVVATTRNGRFLHSVSRKLPRA